MKGTIKKSHGNALASTADGSVKPEGHDHSLTEIHKRYIHRTSKKERRKNNAKAITQLPNH
jgi:hypothetical protein